MRVAVLGATGNVGTAVLRRLQAARSERPDGLEIIGVARRIPEQRTGPYESVQWHSIDVASRAGTEELTEVLRGVDAVIHLVWAIQPNRDEAELHRINVRGTQNMLAAAAEAGV